MIHVLNPLKFAMFGQFWTLFSKNWENKNFLHKICLYHVLALMNPKSQVKKLKILMIRFFLRKLVRDRPAEKKNCTYDQYNVLPAVSTKCQCLMTYSFKYTNFGNRFALTSSHDKMVKKYYMILCVAILSLTYYSLHCLKPLMS